MRKQIEGKFVGKKFLAIVFVFIAISSSADCIYNGFTYPTGTIINGLTCQADGTWLNKSS